MRLLSTILCQKLWNFLDDLSASFEHENPFGLRTGILSIVSLRSSPRDCWELSRSRLSESSSVSLEFDILLMSRTVNICLQNNINFSAQAIRFAVNDSSMVAGLICASPLCSVLLMGKLEPAYQPKSGVWFQRMHQLPLLSWSRTWARSWTSCGVISGALCDLRDQNRLVIVAGF